MQNFSAQETEWMLELDGIELAGFWRRAFAFLIDWALVGMIVTLMATAMVSGFLAYEHHRGRSVQDFVQMARDGKIHVRVGEVDPEGERATAGQKARHEAKKLAQDIVVPMLYFGILLWKGEGQTPGKRWMKIRVVSIVHPHLSFWHCIERALGYGAAALELGFGFVQFFIHPYRRCAQDRLAETIVVTERSYQAMQGNISHLLAPAVGASAPLHTDCSREITCEAFDPPSWQPEKAP